MRQSWDVGVGCQAQNRPAAPLTGSQPTPILLDIQPTALSTKQNHFKSIKAFHIDLEIVKKKTGVGYLLFDEPLLLHCAVPLPGIASNETLKLQLVRFFGRTSTVRRFKWEIRDEADCQSLDRKWFVLTVDLSIGYS